VKAEKATKVDEKASAVYHSRSYMYPFHEEQTKCGQCQSTIQIRFRCPYINKDGEASPSNSWQKQKDCSREKHPASSL